jgi:5-methylcytosine-specific restriction endonuclease McrA
MEQVWGLDVHYDDKLVLLALADYCNGADRSCYPSVTTLSTKTSIPERTLQRILRRLEGLNVLHFTWGVVAGKNVRITHIDLNGQPLRKAASYNSPTPAFRAATIAAFGHGCAYCGRQGDELHDPDGRAWHLDRIVPGSHGGLYSTDNVRLSCAFCNTSKGDREHPSSLPSNGATQAPLTVPHRHPYTAGSGAKTGGSVVPTRHVSGARLAHYPEGTVINRPESGARASAGDPDGPAARSAPAPAPKRDRHLETEAIKADLRKRFRLEPGADHRTVSAAQRDAALAELANRRARNDTEP